ncbi:hypothetical protein [Methylobacterium nonmethylotrophicum]|uniref:Uncharacterized protein n=1 Tax=Methylobacterium nonmethylotrophicum TaxID=1141884 RepID=A0A4Z0NCW2_9HYPH|nr:hypothetical protein [Methylobacterium nonmethylotrophicum]TGD92518.1 hypothetical protein EU555_34560 [Methylobacterium nonmethylotrophicum]
MLSGNDDSATDIRTYPVFEQRWNGFQTIVQGLIGLMIAAGLAGLFGDGPLAHVERPVPGTPVVLRYDRFLRAGFPAQMRVAITRPLDDEHVAVDLNGDFLAHVSVDATQPRAEAVDATPAGVTYRFRLGAERRGDITLMLSPRAYGATKATVSVLGRTVEAPILIYP